MNSGSGLFIIVIGLIVIYLGITGRYKCFAQFFSCASGTEDIASTTKQSEIPTVKPLLPLLPSFPQ